MRRHAWLIVLLALGLVALAPMACGEKDEGEDDDAGTDSDGDSDVDTDADGDSDTDTDTDTDTDGDTDACGPAATIADICALIFDPCDGFGFGDVDNCEQCFINGDTDCAFTGNCIDEGGYFDCMCNCLDPAGCTEFSSCEADCWTASCD